MGDTYRNPNNLSLDNRAQIIVARYNDDPLPIDTTYIEALLAKATQAAIVGAIEHGVDVPVGAATGLDGEFLAANYAQDNLLSRKEAHAEFMTIQRTHELHPGVEPDTIAVTLEPCKSCQDYLAELPNLRLVAFALPLSVASMRRIIRNKEETIFDRAGREGLPYDVIQVDMSNLTEINRTLLDATARDLDTGETRVDSGKLLSQLPRLYHS